MSQLSSSDDFGMVSWTPTFDTKVIEQITRQAQAGSGKRRRDTFEEDAAKGLELIHGAEPSARNIRISSTIVADDHPMFARLDKALDVNRVSKSVIPASASGPPHWKDLLRLPPLVWDLYKKVGIVDLYEWQQICVHKVCTGVSLVYSLPTSGGKTLVAELSLLRCILNQKKKGLFIVPYVSLAREKVESLTKFAEALNFQVELFAGTSGNTQEINKRPSLIICTIEKAAGVVNTLAKESRLDELGCVVVDELHMLGERDRGALLEMVLCKLRVFSKDLVQIVGMSATIPNLNEIGAWLQAEVFISNWRPVPLTEMLKIGNDLLDSKGGIARVLRTPPKSDYDHVAALCAEMEPGKSVLVFCSSKIGVEACAEMIASNLPSSEALIHAEARQAVLGDLKFISSDSFEKLSATIPMGVAFHHAGLTMEEREIIEDAYRNRVIRFLSCTSTLAAGVNLPAARVIIRGAKMGMEPLSASRYKQMCGRAGRRGFDEKGESILISSKAEAQNCLRLVAADVEPVLSAVNEANIGQFTLEAVCIGVTNLPAFYRQTLRYYQAKTRAETEGDELLKRFQSEEASLLEKELLAYHCETGAYEATLFGKGTFRAIFSLDTAMKARAMLLKAQKSMCLLDELHICFCCTPIVQLGRDTVNWQLYERIMTQMDSNPDSIARHVAELVGVQEGFIVKKAHSLSVRNYSADAEMIATRFYHCLILYDLIRERSKRDVAQDFNVEKSFLEALMDSASRFASSMVAFCREQNFVSLQKLVECYIQRLEQGVRSELIPLMEIPKIGRIRARALYDSGYDSLEKIAGATVADLEKLTHLGPPAKRKGIAISIVKSARSVLRDRDRKIMQEMQERSSLYSQENSMTT